MARNRHAISERRNGVMTPEMKAWIGSLLDARVSYRKIHALTGVSTATVTRFNRTRTRGIPIVMEPNAEVLAAAARLENAFERFECYRTKDAYDRWMTAQREYNAARSTERAERKEAA